MENAAKPAMQDLMIYHFLYVSQCVHSSGDVSNLDILREATTRNAELGLTGYLVRCGNRFMQYLEGEPSSLLEIMDLIRQDPRHFDLSILTEGFTATRRFAGWSMGYADLAGVQDLSLATSSDAVLSLLVNIAWQQDPALQQVAS